MESGYSIIIATYKDKESAKEAAGTLVENRLAACVQILPIDSVYLWQGEICSDSEALLLIKSKTELFDKVAKVIMENHEYELPEIIQVPITCGLPEYLKWIANSTI